MTILKHALLGTLKIVFLGSLKVALFVYALFLSDTTYAGTAPEGNGYVGDTYTKPEDSANANFGKVEPDASGRPLKLAAGNRLLGKPMT
jgi:hypothetical protein